MNPCFFRGYFRAGAALGVALGIACAGARAEGPSRAEPPLHLLRSQVIALPAAGGGAPAPTHEMRLDLAVIDRGSWSPPAVLEAARQAVAILAQCGIGTAAIALHEFDVPERYRFFSTPVSRELARRTGLPRPAVFFVTDTLSRPAFEAEAVGRGNSRTRPEMADTVWITAGARDLPLVIAHELAHVLADSGEHSDEPANLMRDESAPGNTQLGRDQCRKIVEKGTANGLLRSLPPRDRH